MKVVRTVLVMAFVLTTEFRQQSGSEKSAPFFVKRRAEMAHDALIPPDTGLTSFRAHHR